MKQELPFSHDHKAYILCSDRLDYVLSTRVTKDEYSRVTTKARSLGFRPSWYLRQLLVDGSDSVRARPPKEHLQTAAKIASMASGLTYLIRLAERRSPLPSEIVAMLDSVHGAMTEAIRELRCGGGL
jgi:hypothetical protein